MKNKLLRSIDLFFDLLLRPGAGVFRGRLSGFRLCAWAGIFASTSLCIVLVVQLRLSLWVVPILAICVVLAFLVLAMATKIVIGFEKLVFYHHLIFIVATCGLALWLTGQPVLVGLDILTLSLGAFHVCGRIGCLFAGCCYGRPHGWGVSYSREAGTNGFPSYLVGVRLFPIQAVESLWVLGIVVVGSIWLFKGAQPGEAFSWYLLAYAMGRFYLELARGDVERPYLWGFSEAQWTSLLLVSALTLGELSGLLVFHAWHFASAGVIAITMIGLAVKGRIVKAAAHELLLPRHVREVALAIDREQEMNGSAGIKIERTSLGLLISISNLTTAGEHVSLYTLSSAKDELTEDAARTVARLLLQLKPSAASKELIRARPGVYQLLVRDAG
jgi:hypothetical protein